MDDVYYIIVTVILGIFVLFIIWCLYKCFRPPSIANINKEDLSDREKQVLYKFCSEMKNKNKNKK